MEDEIVQVSWITSMAEFSCIIKPILELINAKRICEVGASAGANSKVLGQIMREQQGKLISIDPKPQQVYLNWLAQFSDVASHVHDYSLSAIPSIGKVDAWFLDGDHNWYTVYHELVAIEQECQKHDYLPVIFLHDMNWPCARRDMYYDPSQIPAQYLHAHAENIGISMESSGITENGFKGGIWALKEGGPRNGILTAAEDFLAQSKLEYHWVHIPAVLGMAVIVDKRHPYAQEIVDFCAPYHNNPLIATLENDRVEKYVTICKLQDKIKKMSALLNKVREYGDAEVV